MKKLFIVLAVATSLMITVAGCKKSTTAEVTTTPTVVEATTDVAK